MFHVKHAPEPAPEVVAVARDWPVAYVSRETSPNHFRGPGIAQAHLVCRVCDQSVVCLSPGPGLTGYLLTVTGITAQVTAHIRQRHGDSVPAT